MQILTPVVLVTQVQRVRGQRVIGAKIHFALRSVISSEENEMNCVTYKMPLKGNSREI